ncbi:hypothetical protein NOM68_18375, partial [Proteus mirabilis]|nr:hypothetical protein [Proteus mirabilis]
IPTEYIEDERQKIEIYKRIRQLESQEMFEELEGDLLDRFGEYPDEVANLLTVGLIKMNSDFALVEKIQKHGMVIEVLLSKAGTNAYTIEQIFKALSATTLKAELSSDDALAINLKLTKQITEAAWLQEVAQFIEALREQKYAKQAKKQG